MSLNKDQSHSFPQETLQFGREIRSEFRGYRLRQNLKDCWASDLRWRKSEWPRTPVFSSLQFVKTVFRSVNYRLRLLNNCLRRVSQHNPDLFSVVEHYNAHGRNVNLVGSGGRMEADISGEPYTNLFFIVLYLAYCFVFRRSFDYVGCSTRFENINNVVIIILFLLLQKWVGVFSNPSVALASQVFHSGRESGQLFRLFHSNEWNKFPQESTMS